MPFSLPSVAYPMRDGTPDARPVRAVAGIALQEKKMYVPDELLKADGFDDAVLGLADRGTVPTVLAYDYEKCVEILMTRDGMTRMDAGEYMDFNVVGGGGGELTPVFVTHYSLDDLEEIFDAREDNLDAGSTSTPETA